MDTLTWALELLSFGFTPIPERNKTPMVAWKRDYGIDKRKPTEDEIREWFANGESIGILTGKFHGIVVVDADSDEAVQYVQLTTGGSPLRVVSSRGKHFYFRHPGFSVKTNRRLDQPPVDVKGEGGKATGPGSLHKSGMIYRLDDGCDLVSVKELPIYNPSWFPEPSAKIPERKSNTGKVADADSLDRAVRYLAKIPGSGKGNRNQQTFKAACSAIRDFGVDYDAGVMLLNSWDEQVNDPPLGTREIQTIVASALSPSRKMPIGVKVS